MDHQGPVYIRRLSITNTAFTTRIQWRLHVLHSMTLSEMHMKFYSGSKERIFYQTL